MKFSEVIDALIEGKPISRTGWPDGRFLYLEKEHNWFVYQIKKDDEVDDYEMITYTLDLSPEDVAADDWDIDEWALEDKADEKRAYSVDIMPQKMYSDD